MVDRFGKLPEATKNMLQLASLRLRAYHLGIRKIEAGDNGGFFEFNQEHIIDVAYLIDLIRKNPNIWSLEGQTRLRFSQTLSTSSSRIEWIAKMLADMKDNQLASGSDHSH